MTEQPDIAAIRAEHLKRTYDDYQFGLVVHCQACGQHSHFPCLPLQMADALDSARDERDQAELRGCRWHHIRSKAAEMLAEERLDRALAAEALLHAEQDNWAAANVRANAERDRLAAAEHTAALAARGWQTRAEAAEALAEEWRTSSREQLRRREISEAAHIEARAGWHEAEVGAQAAEARIARALEAIRVHERAVRNIAEVLETSGHCSCYGCSMARALTEGTGR